ncbi:MAG: hypothetical protein SWY16_17950 [Cyanobacteriota bacterium]|nr:hypothetical protein [Cyanobacteriota bacterium]
MGLSNFRPGDPNYTSNRDRDGNIDVALECCDRTLKITTELGISRY